MRLVLLISVAAGLAAGAALDVDELRLLHYDVDLRASEPTTLADSLLSRLKDAPPPDHVRQADSEPLILATRSGQEFLCGIPATADLLGQATVQAATAAALNIETANITAALAKAFPGPTGDACLSKTVGWWTYEFCYLDSVKQYHLEGNDIKGDIVVLGEFSSDKEWTQSSISGLVKSPRERFHVQNYTDGTLCGLNNRLRYTEVQFHCDEELRPDESYILSVAESVSCVYQLRVQVGALCALLPFRSLEKPKDPTAVVCRPLLTQDQLGRFHAAKEEAERAKALKEERIKTLMKKRQEEDQKQMVADKERKAKELVELGEYFLKLANEARDGLSEIMVNTYFNGYDDSDLELVEVDDWAFDNGGSSFYIWPEEVMDTYLRMFFEENPQLWLIYRRLFRRYFFQNSGFFLIKWPSHGWSPEDSDRLYRSALVKAIETILSECMYQLDHPQPEPVIVPRLLHFFLSPYGLPALEKANLLWTKKDAEERVKKFAAKGYAEVDRINRQVFDREWRKEVAAERLTRRYQDPRGDAALQTLFERDFEDLFEELAAEAEGELAAAGEVPAGTRLDRAQGFPSLAQSLGDVLGKLQAAQLLPDVVDYKGPPTSKPRPNPFLQHRKEKKEKRKDDLPLHSGHISLNRQGGVGGVSVRELRLGGEGPLSAQLEAAISAQSRELQAQLEKEIGKGGKVEVKVMTAGIFTGDGGSSSFHVLSGDESKELSKLLLSILGGESPEAKEEKRYGSLKQGYTFQIDRAIEDVEPVSEQEKEEP